MEEKEKQAHRSGFVAIVGRPNVGKSTFINAVVKQKIAAVSPKPQTTRNRILGIRTVPGSQMVFLDTPGIHDSSRELNRAMLDVISGATQAVDVLLYLVDSRVETLEAEEEFALSRVADVKATRILVPNKIDLVKRHSLLPLIERFTAGGRFDEVVPVSALTGENLEKLLTVVEGKLPVGPAFYPEDQISDQPERQLAAEIIREKVFRMTEQEVPYGCAVVVEAWDEVAERKLIRIHATIHVEKDSHKRIVIGKKGSMLGQIGQAAREELEELLGTKIYLELFVRVERNWTKDPRAMRRLGLLDQAEE